LCLQMVTFPPIPMVHSVTFPSVGGGELFCLIQKTDIPQKNHRGRKKVPVVNEQDILKTSKDDIYLL